MRHLIGYIGKQDNPSQDSQQATYKAHIFIVDKMDTSRSDSSR